MKNAVTILIFLMTVLTGCAISQSGDASGFVPSTDISALSGVYRNKSETNSNALPPRYLSAFLWRGETSLSNEAVDAVQVAVKNDSLIEAQALGKEGQVMVFTKFERGTHFEFKAGQLQVKPSVNAAGFKSGEPMVGVTKESIIMGLDAQGHAKVRAAVNVNIQTGENWWFPRGAEQALSAGACDLMMPDLMKIGGISGWLHVIGIARAASMPVSSHLFIEASSHVLAVTPTCHWLEFMDFGSGILAHPYQINDGQVTAQGPGLGMAWNESAVARFAVQ